MRSTLHASLVAASALCAALLARSAMAGTSMRSEGDINYHAGFNYSTSTRVWDDRGDLQDRDCRSHYSGLSHYGEYGYSYYYTLFGQIGLGSSRCGADEKTGLGELHLGVRGRLDVYVDDRNWELEAIVPVHGDDEGASHIGCSAFGLLGSVERRDELSEVTRLHVGAGTGVALWEAPLNHQAFAKVYAGAPFLRYWTWSAGLKGEVPLTDRAQSTVLTNLSDCGTDTRVVRSNLTLRYGLTPLSSLSCGVHANVWGREASQTYGFSCGWSRRWE